MSLGSQKTVHEKVSHISFFKYSDVIKTYHSQRKKGSRPGKTPKRDPYQAYSLNVMFPIHFLFF